MSTAFNAINSSVGGITNDAQALVIGLSLCVVLVFAIKLLSGFMLRSADSEEMEKKSELGEKRGI